jgi:Ala-tRNA(Pro) deacylase
MTNNYIFQRLLAILQSTRTSFRMIEHVPEGRTDLASILLGHHLSQAAKSMVLLVGNKNMAPQYILAVVSGDRRIDFEAVKTFLQREYVRLAPRKKAEELTGCHMGGVPPFSFHQDLTLVVDPALLRNDEIVFSAGRLDRSIYLSSAAYVALAMPTIHTITNESELGGSCGGPTRHSESVESCGPNSNCVR